MDRRRSIPAHCVDMSTLIFALKLSNRSMLSALEMSITQTITYSKPVRQRILRIAYTGCYPRLACVFFGKDQDGSDDDRDTSREVLLNAAPDGSTQCLGWTERGPPFLAPSDGPSSLVRWRKYRHPGNFAYLVLDRINRPAFIR